MPIYNSFIIFLIGFLPLVGEILPQTPNKNRRENLKIFSPSGAINDLLFFIYIFTNCSLRNDCHKCVTELNQYRWEKTQFFVAHFASQYICNSSYRRRKLTRIHRKHPRYYSMLFYEQLRFWVSCNAAQGLPCLMKSAELCSENFEEITMAPQRCIIAHFSELFLLGKTNTL